MIRRLLASLLALSLVFASLVLAQARGASHDVGQDIVICSGVGMTTITIGPDGQPVRKSEPCPDGTSVFTATFALPVLLRPEARLVAFVASRPGLELHDRSELVPCARGPPVAA